MADDKKLVRVELTYADGTRGVLDGEAAGQWERACSAVVQSAHVHGVRMPALPWQELPARVTGPEMRERIADIIGPIAGDTGWADWRNSKRAAPRIYDAADAIMDMLTETPGP